MALPVAGALGLTGVVTWLVQSDRNTDSGAAVTPEERVEASEAPEKPTDFTPVEREETATPTAPEAQPETEPEPQMPEEERALREKLIKDWSEQPWWKNANEAFREEVVNFWVDKALYPEKLRVETAKDWEIISPIEFVGNFNFDGRDDPQNWKVNTTFSAEWCGIGITTIYDEQGNLKHHSKDPVQLGNLNIALTGIAGLTPEVLAKHGIEITDNIAPGTLRFSVANMGILNTDGQNPGPTRPEDLPPDMYHMIATNKFPKVDWGSDHGKYVLEMVAKYPPVPSMEMLIYQSVVAEDGRPIVTEITNPARIPGQEAGRGR